MKPQLKCIPLSLLAALAGCLPLWADESSDELKELKGQIEALDQKVRILERQRELDQEASVTAARETTRTTPVITAGASGFSFRSPDTNFVIALHGILQMDSRSFLHDGGIRGNDSFLLRRARPILQGTVFHDFDFLFVPDFGGSTVQIQDAYINYRFLPELQMQAGKFKSPVGLEQLQSDPAAAFNERSLVTDLVPNREVGFEVHGDFASGTLGYAAGIFNGAPDYSGTTVNSDYDDNKAFAGRLFLQPFRTTSISPLQGFGFGVGGSYEIDRASTNTSGTGLTPGYLTDGQQKFFSYSSGVVGNGTHWRVSPQGYYYWGPLSFMGEYAISDQRVSSKTKSADLQNTAWELSGGWVLTGEDASYAGVAPKHPFNPFQGQWGAWQIVGRYAQLNVDEDAFPNFASRLTSASAAHSWAVGVNWYLNRDIRINASFSRTTFTDGTSGAVTRQPEEVLFTRVQLAF